MSRLESSNFPRQAYQDGRVYEVGIRFIRGYAAPDELQVFSRGRSQFVVLSHRMSRTNVFSVDEIEGMLAGLNRFFMEHMVITRGVQLTLSVNE